MDSINDIISSLSPEDIDSLKSIADSIFSSQEQTKQSNSAPDFMGGINPDMIMKISGIMNMLNSQGGNERLRLIEALKPNLSRKRQKKADEAMQMLKLLEILPMLNLLNLNGDENDKS